MKKILVAFFFIIILAGCSLIETEETFLVFNDIIILGENEGTHIPITYSGIKDTRIIINFSNDSVLSFDKEDLFIKANKIGYTKIEISIKDSDYFASIDVYVEAKEIIAPKLQASHKEVGINNLARFYITNQDKVGAPIESFDFTLNDDSLASIDENYLIHPKKEGNLIVTATYKHNRQITASFNLNIIKNSDERIIVSTEENKFTVLSGEYLSLYADGKNTKLEVDYDFTSYSVDIASITADGRVVGIKDGLAYIGVKSKTTAKAGVIYILVEGNENKVNYIERYISSALAETGYKEQFSGFTKYGAWYQAQYALLDWCAMFVAWNANQAGIPTTIIPRLAKVEFIRDFYIRINRFHYKEDYVPVRGDLIIFMSNGASHIGIVLRVENGRVYTIEGNTSNMVAERNYPLNYNTITGYGNPDYQKLNY